MNLMNNLFTYDIFLLEKKAKKEHRPFYGSLTRAERSEFIKKLQNNIIVFRYKKKNDTIRKAEGTLHPKFLPPPKSDKEIVRPEYQMVYYDFDRKDWRSFRSFEFIEILSTRPALSKKEEEEWELKMEEEKKKKKKVEDKSKDKEKEVDIEKEDEQDDVDNKDQNEILKDKRKKKESDD
jgi:type IV secretory pathway VirB10-like protein